MRDGSASVPRMRRRHGGRYTALDCSVRSLDYNATTVLRITSTIGMKLVRLIQAVADGSQPSHRREDVAQTTKDAQGWREGRGRGRREDSRRDGTSMPTEGRAQCSAGGRPRIANRK